MPLSRPAIPIRAVATPAAHWSERAAASGQIPCAVTVCPGNKGRFCATPALIDVGERGTCKTGVRFIASMPRVTKTPNPYGQPYPTTRP